MLRRIGLVLSALVIALASVLLISSPAFAATSQPQATSNNSGNFICSTSTATTSNSAGNLLPLDRWGGSSTSEFTYLPGGITGTIANVPEQTRRGLVSIGLSAGSALWSATSALTTIAEQFCFGSQAAYEANHITGAIWNFVKSAAVIPILVVAGVLLLLWQARKGRRITKELIRIALLVGIIAALGITSDQTTQSDANTGHYPTGSPAWIVTTGYSAITAVVGAPLQGIDTLTSSLTAGSKSSSSGLSCSSYVNALTTEYRDTYGPNVADQSAATVPEMVNGIWEASGLQASANSQFGDNQYTSQAYCHLFEQEAGISPAAQLAVAKKAGPLPPNANSSSLAFVPPGAPSSEVVASMVGWAACTKPGSSQLGPYGEWANVASVQPDGEAQKLFNQLGGVESLGANSGKQSTTNATITHADCVNWWSEPASSFNYQGTSLYWSTSSAAIGQSTTNAPQVSNFLMNFFGDSSTGAIITSIVYALSSVVTLVVFGILSLAVIVAKFGLLLLMALFIIFLVADLVPTRGNGRHSSKFLKQGFTFMLLALGAEAILGLVALLTSVIVEFGQGVAGTGLIGMLWVALAPIAAIWGLHHIMKTFRVPSPFRPDAAMGWAAAAGAGGGFVAGAVGEKLGGYFDRAKGYGRHRARQGAKSAAGSASTKGDSRLYAPKTGSTQRPGMPAINVANQRTATKGRQTPRPDPSTGQDTDTETNGKSAMAGNAVENSGAASQPINGGPPPSPRGDKGGRTGTPASGRTGTPTGGSAAGRTSTGGEAKTKAPNQKPYRTPLQMRIEGTQKRAELRSQRKQAKRFIKEQQEPTLRGRTMQRAHERIDLAKARHKAEPGKTWKRGAAYAAAGAATFVAAPAAVPLVALGLAGHYAVKKGRTALRERPGAKAERKAQISYVARNHINDGTDYSRKAHRDRMKSRAEDAKNRRRERRKKTTSDTTA